MQLDASVFVKAMDEPDFKRRIDVLETPAGFPIMQTFQMHLLYHLSTYYMEYALHAYVKTSQSIFVQYDGVCDWTRLTSVLYKRWTAMGLV